MEKERKKKKKKERGGCILLGHMKGNLQSFFKSAHSIVQALSLSL